MSCATVATSSARLSNSVAPQPLLSPPSPAFAHLVLATMHQCLLIPELSFLIAENCTVAHNWVWTAKEYCPEDKEGLKTLCALARTCRALLKPALNVMWYRQHTLAHLFKCLPEDLWELKHEFGLPEGIALVSRVDPFSLELDYGPT